jgi:hypothetical protein
MDFFIPIAEAQSLIPASGVLGPGCNFLIGDIHFHCVPLYIGYIIKLLLGLVGGFFLFGMMLAGYKYMFGAITAQGTESGKKEIIARIVGLVIIVFSYLLVDTIIYALT